MEEGWSTYFMTKHPSTYPRGKINCLTLLLCMHMGSDSLMPTQVQKRTYERGSMSGLLPGQMAFSRDDILVWGIGRSRAIGHSGFWYGQKDMPA